MLAKVYFPTSRDYNFCACLILNLCLNITYNKIRKIEFERTLQTGSPFFPPSFNLILTDCLIDCRNNRTDKPTNQPNDRLIDRSSDRSSDRRVKRSTDRSILRPTDRLICVPTSIQGRSRQVTLCYLR